MNEQEETIEELIEIASRDKDQINRLIEKTNLDQDQIKQLNTIIRATWDEDSGNIHDFTMLLCFALMRGRHAYIDCDNARLAMGVLDNGMPFARLVRMTGATLLKRNALENGITRLQWYGMASDRTLVTCLWGLIRDDHCYSACRLWVELAPYILLKEEMKMYVEHTLDFIKHINDVRADIMLSGLKTIPSFHGHKKNVMDVVSSLIDNENTSEPKACVCAMILCRVEYNITDFGDTTARFSGLPDTHDKSLRQNTQNTSVCNMRRLALHILHKGERSKMKLYFYALALLDYLCRIYCEADLHYVQGTLNILDAIALGFNECEDNDVDLLLLNAYNEAIEYNNTELAAHFIALLANLNCGKRNVPVIVPCVNAEGNKYVSIAQMEIVRMNDDINKHKFDHSRPVLLQILYSSEYVKDRHTAAAIIMKNNAHVDEPIQKLIQYSRVYKQQLFAERVHNAIFGEGAMGERHGWEKLTMCVSRKTDAKKFICPVPLPYYELHKQALSEIRRACAPKESWMCFLAMLFGQTPIMELNDNVFDDVMRICCDMFLYKMAYAIHAYRYRFTMNGYIGEHMDKDMHYMKWSDMTMHEDDPIYPGLNNQPKDVEVVRFSIISDNFPSNANHVMQGWFNSLQGYDPMVIELPLEILAPHSRYLESIQKNSAINSIANKDDAIAVLVFYYYSLYGYDESLDQFFSASNVATLLKLLEFSMKYGVEFMLIECRKVLMTRTNFGIEDLPEFMLYLEILSDAILKRVVCHFFAITEARNAGSVFVNCLVLLMRHVDDLDKEHKKYLDDHDIA